MKKTLLLLGLTAIVAVPSTGSAKMPLDIPPILAARNMCAAYPGCSSGPCYPECPDPCVQCCNSTCDSCSPTCTNPCKTCPVEFHNMNDTGIASSIATGDDAQYGRDSVAKTNSDTDGYKGFSFTTLTGGCVQDNVTGLTWSPNLGPSNLTGLQDILDQNVNLCGLTGWRMPTIKELVSIVSYHRINPAIDNNVFTDTENVTYRSSTPNAADGTQIWGVNFAYGYADNSLLTDSAYQLRLVRPLP